MYNQQELASIKAHGLESRDVDEQVRKFVKGFKPLQIIAPATAKNGILAIIANLTATTVGAHFFNTAVSDTGIGPNLNEPPLKTEP